MSTDAPYLEVPEPVLDQMVDLLFQDSNPYEFKSILYPGCGKGETIDAVQRYCTQKSTYEMPKGKISAADVDGPVNHDHCGYLNLIRS